MLQYDPQDRIKGLEALAHPYFDELREEGLQFPNGNCLPDLLNFTSFELGINPEPELLEQLIPPWYQKQKGFRVELEKARLKKGQETNDPKSGPATVPNTAKPDEPVQTDILSS